VAAEAEQRRLQQEEAHRREEAEARARAQAEVTICHCMLQLLLWVVVSAYLGGLGASPLAGSARSDSHRGGSPASAGGGPSKGRARPTAYPAAASAATRMELVVTLFSVSRVANHYGSLYVSLCSPPLHSPWSIPLLQVCISSVADTFSCAANADGRCRSSRAAPDGATLHELSRSGQYIPRRSRRTALAI
jgi:hypothetical protein